MPRPAFRAALVRTDEDTAAQYHAALARNGPAFSKTARALSRDGSSLVVTAEKVGFSNTPGSQCGLYLNEVGS